MGEHEREQWVRGYGTMLDVERGSEGAPGVTGRSGIGGGAANGAASLTSDRGVPASVPTVLVEVFGEFDRMLHE